jgi:HSP20 family protein
MPKERRFAMALILRRNPVRALAMVEPAYRPLDLIEEMERMAEELWGEWRPATFIPDLDVYEEKDEVVVKAEVPGLGKDDIAINLEGDLLTIKTEKKEEEVKEGTSYYLRERKFGQHHRSVTLPFPVDAGKVSASFENGLLEIRLPKAEEAKTKQIEIKVK